MDKEREKYAVFQKCPHALGHIWRHLIHCVGSVRPVDCITRHGLSQIAKDEGAARVV